VFAVLRIAQVDSTGQVGFGMFGQETHTGSDSKMSACEEQKDF